MIKTAKKELNAIYDSRASFYGKAYTEESPAAVILYSYNTQILKLDKKTKKIKFLTRNPNHLTQTTRRHINEFIKQFTDGDAMSKKELLKIAGITED